MSLFADYLQSQFEKHEEVSYERLVVLQKASGCWHLDSTFAAATGISLSVLRGFIEKQLLFFKEGMELVWTTLIAIACLEVQYHDNESELKLVVRKAKTWILLQLKGNVGESSVGNGEQEQLLLEKWLQISKELVRKHLSSS